MGSHLLTTSSPSIIITPPTPTTLQRLALKTAHRTARRHLRQARGLAEDAFQSWQDAQARLARHLTHLEAYPTGRVVRVPKEEVVWAVKVTEREFAVLSAEFEEAMDEEYKAGMALREFEKEGWKMRPRRDVGRLCAR